MTWQFSTESTYIHLAAAIRIQGTRAMPFASPTPQSGIGMAGNRLHRSLGGGKQDGLAQVVEIYFESTSLRNC